MAKHKKHKSRKMRIKVYIQLDPRVLDTPESWRPVARSIGIALRERALLRGELPINTGKLSGMG